MQTCVCLQYVRVYLLILLFSAVKSMATSLECWKLDTVKCKDAVCCHQSGLRAFNFPLVTDCVLIGASLSGPHMYEKYSKSVCIIIYVYIYIFIVRLAVTLYYIPHYQNGHRSG